MNRRRLVLILFGALCLAQLGVASFAIAKHERTLRSGERFRFEVAPVDPADPLRGRYLWLGFPAATLETAAPEGSHRRVYAVIERGADGYARFGDLSAYPPAGRPYLKTRSEWVGPNRVRLDLPFARYYVEESIARAAEKALAEHLREGGGGAYVDVRVLDGHAVLEELYFGGVALRERMRERATGRSR